MPLLDIESVSSFDTVLVSLLSHHLRRQRERAGPLRRHAAARRTETEHEGAPGGDKGARGAWCRARAGHQNVRVLTSRCLYFYVCVCAYAQVYIYARVFLLLAVHMFAQHPAHCRVHLVAAKVSAAALRPR